MLDLLLAYLDRQDHPDDPLVRIESVGIAADVLTLRLAITNYDGDELWRNWQLELHGVRSYRIEGADGGLQFFESGHVLDRQFTNPHQELYFHGTPNSAAEVAGRLLLAHRALVGDWIPFETYLNTQLPLDRLLASGAGRLGGGPSFLVREYAQTLSNCGMRISLTDPIPAKSWNGSSWTETPPHLATLLLGGSYFIASGITDRELTAI